MSNATAIETQSDFLAFIKDEAMANGNLSIRGVARCCDVPHTSLIRGGAFTSNKLHETLSSKGFHAGALTSNGFPPQAVWLCIEYFAYDSKADAPMAKQLARTFGAIGIMTTLGKLTEEPDMPDTQPIVDPLASLRESASIAIALAGGGGAMAIEAFKLIHGIYSPNPSKPPTSPSSKAKAAPMPPIVSKAEQDAEDIELIRDFLTDVQTLVDAGILGPWNVSTVTQKFKPYITIVLHKVIPILQDHFHREINRERLESAIVRTGGSTGQTQRFSRQGASESDRKYIQSKCITIPTALVKI